MGTCTIEDTGRHPSSLSTGRRPAAARVPPLCAHARAHALKHFDTRACAHKHSTMQKLLSLFLSRARAFFLSFFRHMQSQEPAHVLKRPYSTYDIHCQIGAGSACAQLSLQYIRCLLPDRRLIMCSSIPIQLIPADMAPPESRIRIPESRSWIVHRSLSWKSGKKSPVEHPGSGFGRFRRGHVCGKERPK